MIRLFEVAVPLEGGFTQLRELCARRLGVSPKEVLKAELFRRGLDTRRGREPHYSCTVDVTVRAGERELVKRAGKARLVEPYSYVFPGGGPLEERPVVVGAGPAGLFCALFLARAGARPILLERGLPVAERRLAVESFWSGGPLDTRGNVQFGEGGAGTFSDGKLTTGIKDPRARQVFLEFVRAGAPEEILVDAKPHIGTDRLGPVVERLREDIRALGGEVRFREQLLDLDIRKGRLRGCTTERGELPCAKLVLALGHSARDTFQMLKDRGVALAPKPFAMGARIEHRQEWLDRQQFGGAFGKIRERSTYQVSCHLPDGRGVYTFCMCPGGLVVASSSEPGTVVTNGMSRWARDGENANSALLVGVGPQDFPGEDALSGMHLQRELEKRAFLLGGGDYRAPAQRVGDFLAGRVTEAWGEVRPSYCPGVKRADLTQLLPEFIARAMAQGLLELDRKLPGFAHPDAVLTAPETRSSSPVRILRGRDFQSVNVAGLYPCGEGAGYAGGIVSAAADGIRVAEAVCGQALGKA